MMDPRMMTGGGMGVRPGGGMTVPDGVLQRAGQRTDPTGLKARKVMAMRSMRKMRGANG